MPIGERDAGILDSLGGQHRALGTQIEEAIVAHARGFVDNDQLRPAVLTGDANRLSFSERDALHKPLLLEARPYAILFRAATMHYKSMRDR